MQKQSAENLFSKIPSDVIEAGQKLLSQNFRAYLAGGCVRDLVLGTNPQDYDLVTNAPIEKLREIYPNHLDVGVKFGVLKLKNPSSIDIAIFRKDLEYSDFRHPDGIEIGNEITDTARRDFTINGLYLDLRFHDLIDHVGGLIDLESKLLKCIGDPGQRFREDALRILRAARFQAQLGFKLDKPTSVAMKTNAKLLTHISRERIRSELFKLLETARPLVGLESLLSHSLWECIFGNRKIALPADMRQLKLAYKPPAMHWLCGLAITGLLGDVGQTLPDRDLISENLRLSNAEERLLGLCMSIYCDSELSQTKAIRDIHHPKDWLELGQHQKEFIDLLKAFVRRARGPSENQKKQALNLLDQVARILRTQKGPFEFESAQSFMDAGLKPSPQLGDALKQSAWERFWTFRPTP